MDSIEYYNKYASMVFDDTVGQDTTKEREPFQELLEEGSTILDMGCGSGRDSLSFYELGYDVTPLDASEEMCKLAEIHTGLSVLQMKYEDMDFDCVFDGIWARAALIHTPKEETEGILDKMVSALHEGGIIYLSLMEGEFEGFRGECYYAEYTQKETERLIRMKEDLELIQLWKDHEDGEGGQGWIHLILKRK